MLAWTGKPQTTGSATVWEARSLDLETDPEAMSLLKQISQRVQLTRPSSCTWHGDPGGWQDGVGSPAPKAWKPGTSPAASSPSHLCSMTEALVAATERRETC